MSTSSQPQLRIFVSHSSKDNTFSLKLVKDLRLVLRDEDAVWYDVEGGLQGGDTWWRKIVAELMSRNVFIVVLSSDSMASAWVNDEIDLAWRQKNSPMQMRILPVQLHQCEVRAELYNLQIINFTSPKSYEEAFNELLIALGLPPKFDPPQHVSKPVVPSTSIVEQMLSQIKTAFAEQDWPVVIRKTNLLIKRAPDDISAAYYSMHGVALREEGDLQRAQEAFETALTLVDDRQERLTILRNYTELLSSQEKWNEVLRSAKEALRLVPNDLGWLATQEKAQRQLERDIADIPFSPNPQVEEERLRQAESKKRLQAEEAERIGSTEEERQQRHAIDISQTLLTSPSDQYSYTMPQAHPSLSQPATTNPIIRNMEDIDTKRTSPPSLNVPIERTISRRAVLSGIGWAAGFVVVAGGISLALSRISSNSESAIIGLLFSLVGAAFCFFGYRFFRILITIWGFFVGFNLGTAAMTAIFSNAFLGTTTGIVLGLVIGIVFAVLAYFFYYFAIVLLGASAGYSLGSGIIGAIVPNNPGSVSVIVGVVLAVIFVFVILILNLPKLLIIVFTALGGAVAVIVGFLILIQQAPVAYLQFGEAVALVKASWVWAIVAIALAVVGFLVQWSTMRTYELEWSESSTS